MLRIVLALVCLSLFLGAAQAGEPEESGWAVLGNSSSGSSSSSNADFVFTRAMDLATGRGDAQLTVEHFLIALLDNKAAVELLDAHYLDREALRTVLEDRIDTVATRAGAGTPSVDSSLRQVLQRATLKSIVTDQRGATGADYVLAILVQDDTFAAQALRDHGLTLEVAKDTVIEQQVARNEAARKRWEEIKERVDAQRRAENAESEHQPVLSQALQSGARDRGPKHYRLRIMGADGREGVRFKAAVSRNGRLELYVEETPFEVEFTATRIAALFEAVSGNAALKVELISEVGGEQRVVSSFGGEAGAIFKDPREPHRQRSGRL